jgi:hypothetical protein
VLVAGGGPAGVPAALAAARLGASVILCHDRPVLGGNASSEVRMHIVGADCSGHRCGSPDVEAREGGLIEEIRLDAAVRNPQRSPALFDLLLYDKCRSEPNLKLLLNATVDGAVVRDGTITHALATRPSTEERFEIAAKIFVDCTGDGRLAVEAGAEFRVGREARSEFGESLAVDTADTKRLGSTLMFQAKKHDRPMPFTPPAWARKFTEHDLRLRPHASAEVDLGLEFGYWWVEWGGELDTIRDNETIRDELLAILLGVWDHVKNGGDHGAANWALEWCGFVPGKRESRRFVGQYMLREQDVLGSTPQPDAIAYGGWHIDTHPPGGVDAIDEDPCTQHRVPKLYDIPLRSCISRNLTNLMFAGRNLSATHIAFASTRVMATCAVVGQGVGTAAAMAVRYNRQPAELADDGRLVTALQQQLLRDDVYLIGLTNELPDHARRATITASSFVSDGEPMNVVSGQTRSVHGERGAPTDRARPGTHRWISGDGPFPQTLELAWDAPIAMRQVQLVFDTGMFRPLTFTLADAYAATMLWGRPQPETVRDYAIEVDDGGGWQPVLAVAGNYQRLRRHPFDEPRSIRRLRVVVLATNGAAQARICEIRVE